MIFFQGLFSVLTLFCAGGVGVLVWDLFTEDDPEGRRRAIDVLYFLGMCTFVFGIGTLLVFGVAA